MCSRLSMTKTLIPADAQRSAITLPANPAPTTRTSVFTRLASSAYPLYSELKRRTSSPRLPWRYWHNGILGPTKSLLLPDLSLPISRQRTDQASGESWDSWVETEFGGSCDK